MFNIRFFRFSFRDIHPIAKGVTINGGRVPILIHCCSLRSTTLFSDVLFSCLNHAINTPSSQNSLTLSLISKLKTSSVISLRSFILNPNVVPFLHSKWFKGIVGASSNVLGENKAFLKLKYLLWELSERLFSNCILWSVTLRSQKLIHF